MKIAWVFGVAAALVAVLAGCGTPSAEPALTGFFPDVSETKCILRGRDGNTVTLYPGKAYAKFNITALQLPDACAFSDQLVYSVTPVVRETILLPLLADYFHGVSVRKIAVDAGHGGGDPGAKGARYLEKDLNLSLARTVAGALRKEGFEVVMLRDSDCFLALDERVFLAEKSGADLFISIHHNSSTRNPDASGTETFTLNPSPGEPRCAAGTLLAALIQSRIAPAAGGPDRGVKFANFRVLRKSKVPAVLIEAGFVSNSAEEKQLSSPVRHAALGAAVASAVRAFCLRQRR